MMRYKIHAAFLAVILALASVCYLKSGAVRTVTAAPAAASSLDLLSILPASDVVAFVDVRRGLSEVLPHVLINDSAMLQRINNKIAKLKDETGADLNLLDTVAIGLQFKDSASLDPQRITVLARGRFDASEVTASVVNAVKARQKFQPKEESYEGKTIYTLEASPREPLTMTVLDSTTLAFGDPAGVRAAIDASSGRGERADAELTGLATSDPNAIAGFAGRVPSALTKSLVEKDDDFSQVFSNIRLVYGAATATDTKGELLVTLRTDTTEQAQALGRKISALKQIASIYLSNSSSKDDQQQSALTARVEDETTVPRNMSGVLPFPPSILKNSKITTLNNEVQVSLEQTLTDLAPIVRPF